MRADKAYLALHGRQWRVEVFVPRHLREYVGKAKLVVPLKTDSLALANREKHKHVHALKQEIAKAELEAKRKGRQVEVAPRSGTEFGFG